MVIASNGKIEDDQIFRLGLQDGYPMIIDYGITMVALKTFTVRYHSMDRGMLDDEHFRGKG